MRGAAALVAGAALGAAAAAGAALLLYTGQGFLRAAGLLVSSTMMAVGAGLWAGAPHGGGADATSSRGRWIGFVAALLAAGAFSALWTGRAALRDAALGGALSVLLIVALPAYMAGALLVSLHTRELVGRGRRLGGSVAVLAVAGAALGVLLATTVLIQNLEPWGIYYGTAGVLVLFAAIESRPLTAVDVTGAMDMKDHVVIITGVGSRGQVGFAVARAFRGAGARLVITDRSGGVAELAAELGGERDVVAVRADLLLDEDVEALVRTARERFGRLDALVNVAGGLRVIAPLAETTPEQWQGELERNAGTVLRTCRAALPLLRESRGAIVNFASPAGLRAAAGIGAYSAAKAAVVALTRALALEEKGSGVRVNAIAPGMVDTEQNRAAADDDDDAAYVARDDVASVAVFLAGPGAAGISGETIQVTRTTPR
jgi:NAD(P)-dependent dehydrogenase (short-subunit alcohol dehydrogenase family)